MIDYEAVEMAGTEASKALRDMMRQGDMHDPNFAEAIKTLVSIAYKADCMTGDSGNSEARGNSYDNGSSYRSRHWVRGHYSRDGSDYSNRDGYARGSLDDHFDAMIAEAKDGRERQQIENLRRQMMR